MHRDFQLPGRSPVIAAEGMAATSHPLATLAAIEALRAGGTAADAAVAACAVQCVVEPHMTGIGGDCFCLVDKPGAPVWGYNGSGRAGAATDAAKLRGQGMKTVEMDSVHAVTVPGSIEAWEEILKTHGKFGLDRALQPAIRYAEQGFPVAPRIADDWAGRVERLRQDAGASRHYLRDGNAPVAGDIVRLPALAETLKAIAAGGAKAFYTGPIAEDMASTVTRLGGSLSVDDLAQHKGEIAQPIASEYRGVAVHELPPNGQGLAALVLLNILEQFDFASLDAGGAKRLHLALEACRIAYAVRDTHIAEPSHMRTAVEALLDKKFARELAGTIDPTKRSVNPKAPSPASNTVYLTVVDRDRMAVSFINSLYGTFGGGIATEKTGIMLHNRGACFVLDEGHPNELAPGKRPMHTIIPGLMRRGDRCEVSFGVMGGHFQSMGHALFVSNMVDYGMNVQQAIDAPRVFFEGPQTTVEHGVPSAVIDELRGMGHDIGMRTSPLGGGQAIAIDWERGVLIGGSDHRKDGCALGY
jgi:gamma-glutamyltranspeptidase/glutathione hydrolase